MKNGCFFSVEGAAGPSLAKYVPPTPSRLPSCPFARFVEDSAIFVGDTPLPYTPLPFACCYPLPHDTPDWYRSPQVSQNSSSPTKTLVLQKTKMAQERTAPLMSTAMSMSRTSSATASSWRISTPTRTSLSTPCQRRRSRTATSTVRRCGGGRLRHPAPFSRSPPWM